MIFDLLLIKIDEDVYFRDNYQNRRRFSLGHEIGHYVLHKTLYKKLSFKTEAEWIEFIGLIPETEYSFIEYHAYEFSGKLLVPKVQLIRSLKEAKSKLSSVFEMIKSYVFSYIGREFLVSEVVIEKRINSEQINVNEIFEFFQE
jgi:Zn-dependent peptidase ImmA (M78 family)